MTVIASLVKKTVKGHEYYYLVESGRVNGKPRIVRQQYLGTLENIAKAVSDRDGDIPEPEYSTVLQFGSVCALFDIAERLGIREMIDAAVGKRLQGLPVSDTILLAAINRAVMPESKNGFYGWFRKTVLHNCFPLATEKNLSSQGFWNNMSQLNESTIQVIEDEITRAVVQEYDISTECLMFDNTNFFTYVDTDTPSTLPKRGKSKEHRSDLKIVGLSMMVSPDHSIPLFHETYSGNMNDAKRFGEVVDSLKARYRKLGKGECKLTLVFDKGNNSADNICAVMDGVDGFDFVGGLRFNQCTELGSVDKEKLTLLEGERLEKTSAYRETKEIYGRELTVVVTYNQELYDAQISGVVANIAKCTEKLDALKERLTSWREKVITKGKRPTIDSVKKNIADILSAEHMKTVFDYEVSEDEESQAVILEYRINADNFETLKSKRLGRSILFTSHMDWSTEKIVSVYRSQYHVEEAFKRMKDTKYLSFRPVRHFTDSSIRVHAFYCVLALLLTSLLNREFEEMGHKISIHKMLDEFQLVQQVITYFPNKKKKRCVFSFSGLDGSVSDYINKYNLTKYALKAG